MISINTFESELLVCFCLISAKSPSVCDLPINIEGCDDTPRVYAYDKKEHECKKFYACKSNENVFSTQEGCENTCVQK